MSLQDIAQNVPNDLAPYISKEPPPPGDFVLKKVAKKEFYTDENGQEKERTVYKDEARAIIRVDTYTTLETPIDQKYIDMYPERWESFISGQQENIPEHETAVGMWAYLTPAQVATLKMLQIHTVEALARVGENMVMHFHDGPHLRRKALEFVEAKQLQDSLDQHDSEKARLLDALEAQNKNQQYLQQQVEQLQAQLETTLEQKASEMPEDALSPQPKKKRGRPKKG